MGRTVHLTLSPSAVQVLREELDLELGLDAFDPAALGGTGPGRIDYHHHQDFRAGIASGSFPTGGMVIIPCSMSTLGAIAERHHDQSHHPRRGRAPQGAPQARAGPSRDAVEPDPSRKHGDA